MPVLLIVFNRPETTRRVLDALRPAAPRQLYVHADGARPDRPGEAGRCEQTRRLFANVGWDCTVHERFQDRNLGITAATAAIDWFFGSTERGIILHDDCMPSPSFYRYCDELLDRYRDTDEVAMICGYNGLCRWQAEGSSYFFSRTAACWGWASWRRAWALHDPAIGAWRDPAVRQAIAATMSRAEFRIAARRFDLVQRGGYRGYDFAWQFALLAHRRLAVMPAVNQIRNIGFQPGALFTGIPWPHEADVPAGELAFPLANCPSMRADEDYQRELFGHTFPLLRRRLAPLGPPSPWLARLTALVSGPRRSGSSAGRSGAAARR